MNTKLYVAGAAAALVLLLGGCGGVGGEAADKTNSTAEISLAKYLFPSTERAMTLLERRYEDTTQFTEVTYGLSFPILYFEDTTAVSTSEKAGVYSTGTAYNVYDYGSSIGFEDNRRMGVDFTSTAGDIWPITFPEKAAAGDVLFERDSESGGLFAHTSCTFDWYTYVPEPDDYNSHLYEDGLRVECESRAYASAEEREQVAVDPVRAIRAQYVFVKGYGIVYATGVSEVKSLYFGNHIYEQKKFDYYIY